MQFHSTHLDNCEYDQQGGQNLQVWPLRVKVEQPEEDGAGIEAAADAVELKISHSYINKKKKLPYQFNYL
jgi:hypothetical protein